MVRESTHRPRRTEDLLVDTYPDDPPERGEADAAREACEEALTVVCEGAVGAPLVLMASTKSDEGDDGGDDDDDTIVQQAIESLDEEIQSTIDELQTVPAMQIHRAPPHGCIPKVVALAPSPTDTSRSSSAPGKQPREAGTTTSVPATTSAATATTTKATNTLGGSDSVSDTLSEEISSCLGAIEARSARSKDQKRQPLFSESIKHMQRWRNLQEKGRGGDKHSLPKSSSGSLDIGFPLMAGGKGKGRARKESTDSLGTASSLTNVKLPRPRSWVNSLLSVGSNGNLSRLAGTAPTRQRHHSFDVQGAPRSFQGETELEPVSSLVLQGHFDGSAPSWSSNYGNAPLGHAEQSGQRYGGDDDYYDKNGTVDDDEDDERAVCMGRHNTRTSLGALVGATQSTPNLPSSSSNTFVKRKPAPPLLLRNLDDDPRGTLTPSIPPVNARKLTNPWSKMAQEVGTTPLSERSDLIGADEEEAIMDEAVSRERQDGTMADEERAVLDMLDQMNGTVDTFERPTVSRAQSRAARSQTQSSDDDLYVDEPAAMPVLSSPSRPSVKAFASALEQGITHSRSSSPVRAGASSTHSRSASPVRGSVLSSKPGSSLDRTASAISGASSTSSGQSGVRKAVEERERLDLEVKSTTGSLSSAINNVLRTKTSFGSFLSAGFLSNVSSVNGEGSSLLNTQEAPSGPPQRREYLRQESAPIVASYASQTNAFLNRRPTHAADKHLTHSPNQSSYVSSSAQGSNSTLWSRPILPDSPSTGPTSPGLPSSSEDGLPFRYGFGKFREVERTATRYDAPLLRRLMTDATGATSVSSFDNPPSPTKDAVRTAIEEEDVRPTTPAGESKASLFRTPTRSSKHSASTRPPTPPQKEDASSSPLETPRPAFASLDANYSPEGGVSPGRLGTPKRAKDLIRFFEQNSAPNSPRAASRLASPSPAVVGRSKKALACSGGENQVESVPASLAFRVPSSILAEPDAVQEKISVQAVGRPRMLARGLVGVGSTGAGDLFSSQDETNPSDDENTPLSSTLPRRSGQRRTSRQTSGSFFGKVLKASPNRKSSEPAGNGIATEAVDGGSNGSSSRQGVSPTRKSGASPFKSGMNRLVSALTPGINRVANAGVSMGGAGERSDTGMGGLPSNSHPPTSYRAPDRSKANRDEKSKKVDEDEGAEQDDGRSAVSSRTMGTTRSFRQKTESGSNLRLDMQSSMDLMGQPGAQPFRTGFVYYFNVHAAEALWQWAQAVLLPSAIALSWIPSGGGRVSVVLDLSACREVHSVPGPDHPSCVKDVGAQTAREQGLNRISPWQLIFDDGVERMAVESAKDRVQWVSAVWDALGSARGSSAMRRRASTGPPAILETSPTVAEDVQMTSIASPPTPPPNFSIQLSDAPVQRTASWARKVVPSGLAAGEASGEEIDRIGSIWKSEMSSDQSHQEREQPLSIAEALGTGPPVPPKEKKKKKRFVDDGDAAKFASRQAGKNPSVVHTATDPICSVPASLEERSSSGLAAAFIEELPVHSQETLVSAPGAISERSKSVEEFASAESHQPAQAEEDDDFGPRSPRSDAMFGWTAADERDLLPGDSASQRPARSQTGTISSRFTAIARPSDERASETVTPKTPAQTIRDTVMGNVGIDGGQAARGLDTVVEETVSQTAGASNPRRSIMVGPSEMGATMVSPTALPSPSRPKSVLSMETTGSISSQDVGRLLQYLEQQQQDRDQRDAYLESQFRSFQDALYNLQHSSKTKSRRSGSQQSRATASELTSDGSNAVPASAAASVAADAASLAVMQEKLDKVLSMVGHVFADQNRMEQDIDAPRGPQPPALTSTPELARIETTLQSLMSRIQQNSTGPGGMPALLSAHNRDINMDGGRALDGRDRAILADRLVKGTVPSSRRMSAPPDMEDEQDDNSSGEGEHFMTPMQAHLVPMTPSMSDSQLTSTVGVDRIPPRDWHSSQGIPSPPANTDRDGSLLSSVAPRPRGGPVERAALGMTSMQRGGSDQNMLRSISQYARSDVPSLDMEAEIRRRRMMQTSGVRAEYPENQQGGWYSPHLADTPAGPSQGPRFPGQATSGVPRDRNTSYSTIAANEVVGATPWARKGLGLSMGGQAMTPRPNPHVSQAIQTPALEDRLARNGDLAAVLDAIKDNDRARQSQQKQQVEIARYLNELNSWLERDVVDRSKEWRTLALGVTQLHEELNALKTGHAVQAVGGPGARGVGAVSGAGPSVGFAAPAGAAAGMGMGAALGQSTSAAAGLDTAFTAALGGASGPSGPRGMPGGSNIFTPPTPLQPARGGGVATAAAPTSAFGPTNMPLTRASIDALGLGIDAPAPIASPGPSPSIKRSGTRTWRAEASPGPYRNDDVWSRSGTLKEKKKQSKEEKKAAARSRRREALGGSNFGRLAAAAGGAALVAAATHEYDKYKARQRNEGKPEEASKDIDDKTGTFVRHDEVPEVHAEKIKEAVEEGDEVHVREAIKGAAEVGAGTAAIQKLVQWIKAGAGAGGGGTEDDFDDVSTLAPSSGRPSDGTAKGGSAQVDTATSTGLRTAKNSGTVSGPTSFDSEQSETLRSAVAGLGAGAGGGALALAVEEILKHLLEKKEEEKRRTRELAEVEAQREVKKRTEEEQRELRLQALREREKNELVETILAKLQQEKSIQEAEAAARQREMDPKSAIESLVSAINTQRASDAAQQAAADNAIKQMANDLVRTTSEQNGKLVEAVHGAAREMLRHNVETHAEDLKRLLSKEVSGMFEDVGKIREAKRALEFEIADLFSIKSRHLIGLNDVARNGAFTVPIVGATLGQQNVGLSQNDVQKMINDSVQQSKHPLQQPVSSWAQPINSLQQPYPMGMPGPVPKTQGVGVGEPVLGEVSGIPQILTTAVPKRDLIGPFSVNFGPRKK